MLITAVPFFRTHHVPAAAGAGLVLATLVAAAPIAVSTVIICSNGACMLKLRRKGIRVLNTAKLKAAADVGIVCFDKTGTLTDSAVSTWRP